MWQTMRSPGCETKGPRIGVGGLIGVLRVQPEAVDNGIANSSGSHHAALQNLPGAPVVAPVMCREPWIGSTPTKHSKYLPTPSQTSP